MTARGRRRVLIVVIFLMAGATASVAFLPGYATIGLLAPITLLLLRAVQGLAAGGELGVAAVFILEHAPEYAPGSGRRLAHGNDGHSASAPAWPVVAVLSHLFADAGQDTGWWRIAFLVAIPLGLIGLLLRRRITDTDQFLTLRAESALLDRPVQELWRHHRPSLLRGFCLLAAGSLAFNTFFIFMPNNLIARHGAG